MGHFHTSFVPENGEFLLSVEDIASALNNKFIERRKYLKGKVRKQREREREREKESCGRSDC